MSNFTQYLSDQSLLAEQTVFQAIEDGKLGEAPLDPELDWDKIEAILPKRVAKIKQKAELLSGPEGWDQLGIDAFFEWEGRKIAVDITTGSSTVIKNKRKKMTELLPYLGGEYLLVVLTIRRDISLCEWEDFLISLHETSEEILDYRLV